MAFIIRNKLLTPIVTFVFSLLLIVLGTVLTVSVVFIFIGIPLLIIGILLLITSVFLFITGLVGGVAYSFGNLFRKRTKIEKKTPKRRISGKVIDVTDEGGVYKAR